MPKTKTPLTPEERLELAKRYLKNAKEVLKKSPIDKGAGVYEDLKYVSEASGTAYLSALEALKALFLWEGLITAKEIKNKLKKIDMYAYYLSKTAKIGKDRDVLLKLFDSVYVILHLGGYYRELQNKKAIDAGFESVEKIIKIVERHINGKG
ncbi:MAG: DUF5618 family protein [candidate division WOR-3 bacterium]